jgi:hypothetical protein
MKLVWTPGGALSALRAPAECPMTLLIAGWGQLGVSACLLVTAKVLGAALVCHDELPLEVFRARFPRAYGSTTSSGLASDEC